MSSSPKRKRYNTRSKKDKEPEIEKRNTTKYNKKKVQDLDDHYEVVAEGSSPVVEGNSNFLYQQKKKKNVKISSHF